MKAWLKGGLWGAGIGLIILAIGYMLDSRFASNVPSYGNFLCGLTFYRELVSISNQLANYSLISFIFLIGFYILIGFLIGSLFGGIISIKNKKIIIGKPKK